MDARLLAGGLPRRRVGAGDRIFFPFSFGPFLGFWTAFDAATQIGAHAIPAGGMTSASAARPDRIAGAHGGLLHADLRAAAARRGARSRRRRRRRWPATAVRTIIVAGEPGGQHSGHAPPHRARLGGAGHRPPRVDRGRPDQLRVPGGARVPARQRTGVHRRGRSTRSRDGAGGGRQCRGELVITNLGRTASPLIRYRTGDLVGRDARAVRAAAARSCASYGGILARADDMVNIRGCERLSGRRRDGAAGDRRRGRVPLHGADGPLPATRWPWRSKSAAAPTSRDEPVARSAADRRIGVRRRAAGSARPERPSPVTCRSAGRHAAATSR